MVLHDGVEGRGGGFAASDMVQMHRPDRVISMLDPEWSFPEMGTRYVDRHLCLAFHDVNVPSDDEVGPRIPNQTSTLSLK
ncbi:MAG: hypothetical protein ACREMQ_00880 [Longimicrobiales bacterium]